MKEKGRMKLGLSMRYSHPIFVGEIIGTTLCDDPGKGSLLWHQRGFSSAVIA